jgi:hypothetical protein
MKITKVLLWLCILVIVASSFLGIANKPTHAQDSAGNEAEVLAKLTQILDNQKAILDQLASMKEELRIIKIRITQQQ